MDERQSPTGYRTRIRERLTYANVMSTIAVFGVLAGGGAYAASKIDSGDIKRNAVRSKHIKNGEVKRADLAHRAVSTSKLGNLAVTNPKLADGVVSTAKLGDLVVTGAKLAENSVTSANVVDDSLSGTDISDGSIGTNDVGQGFLTQAGGSRALRFFAHEWNTGSSTNIEFGRVTLQPVATNQFKVCFNFIGPWGYGISIDGGALTLNTPAGNCGPTHTVTTGGSFQINDGLDMIFGSGDASTSGYYFVYGLYSP